jgi:hypothetical protein
MYLSIICPRNSFQSSGGWRLFVGKECDLNGDPEQCRTEKTDGPPYPRLGYGVGVGVGVDIDVDVDVGVGGGAGVDLAARVDDRKK